MMRRATLFRLLALGAALAPSPAWAQFITPGNTIGTGTSVPLTGNTNYDLIWTGPATVGTGLLYESGGKVGIGTPTPTKLLTVYGGDASINGATIGIGSGNLPSNTVLGVAALQANTTGINNTALGWTALQANTIGTCNTALGAATLQLGTTGNFNTAIGVSTLNADTTGYSNTATGAWTLQFNTTGYANTATGSLALNTNTTGTGNTATGISALFSNTAGNYNTAFGYNTGRGIVTGSNNTIIGANVTGLGSTLSNTVILADGSGNQRLYINSSGYAGIGTTSPQATLDVAGYARLALQTAAPATCAAANAGAVALNHLGQLCACYSSAWKFADSTGATCSW